MSFNLFGYSIGKNKTSQITAPKNEKRGRTSMAIKKQYRRELQYQIADINTAIRMATNPDAPDRSRLIEIYKYITKDLRLKGQIRDAVMKVTGEPWMFYKPDGAPDEAISDNMRKRWLAQTIKMIAQVEFWAYTVLEYDDIQPKDWNIGVVYSIPREHISIERAHILIDAQVNGAYIDYAGISQDLDLVEFYEDRENLGMLLEVAYNTIWKFYANSDWSRTSEKYGMPILGIEANTSNDAELDRLEEQAANFGTDGYIIAQGGDKVNILERTGQRIHDIFLDRIKLSNEENEIGINGQVGTSSEKSFVGAAEVQERKFEDITLTRLDFVKNEINDKLLPYLRYKGFAIPDGYYFDYPVLMAERKRKLQSAFQKENPTPDTPIEKEAKEAGDKQEDVKQPNI